LARNRKVKKEKINTNDKKENTEEEVTSRSEKNNKKKLFYLFLFKSEKDYLTNLLLLFE